MSSIFITIKSFRGESWIELITEAHRTVCPIASSSSTEKAYDWCVCPKRPNGEVHAILSGSCEWQSCGIEEYAIDLKYNLSAGILAYGIAKDYEAFLMAPREWLDAFSGSGDEALETQLILEISQV